jgi:hypothetical protein
VAAAAIAGVRALRRAVAGVQTYVHHWQSRHQCKSLAVSKSSCAALISFVLLCRPVGVERVPACTHQWRAQPDARRSKLERPAKKMWLSLLVPMGFIAWFAFALDVFDLSVRNIQNKQWKDLTCVHVGCLIMLSVFKQSSSVFLGMLWHFINVLGSSRASVYYQLPVSVGTDSVWCFLTTHRGCSGACTSYIWWLWM